MKSNLLNLAIVAITIAAVGWITRDRYLRDRSAPDLILKPAIVELGKVSTSSPPVEAVLRIQNNSHRQMLVTNISTSCGCTTAGLAGASELAPGESRAIAVTFANGERTGEIQAAVSVEARSDDGKKSEATSIIRSHGVAAVAVEPKAVRLGVNEYGRAPNQVSVHLERGEEALEWDGIECQAGPALALRTTRPDANSFAVEVSLKELNGVIGAGSDKLSIYLTSHGARLKGRGAVLPVSWEITHPSLSVHPSMVYLGLLAQNSAHTGTIRIAATEGSRLQALDTTSASERLRVRLEPGARENLVESRYSVSTGSITGEFSSIMETKVLFEGAQYVVRTPVIGYVR